MTGMMEHGRMANGMTSGEVTGTTVKTCKLEG